MAHALALRLGLFDYPDDQAVSVPATWNIDPSAATEDLDAGAAPSDSGAGAATLDSGAGTVALDLGAGAASELDPGAATSVADADAASFFHVAPASEVFFSRTTLNTTDFTNVVASKKAPSILLKAYAIALRSLTTTETDLSNPDQAIFVANLQEKGIPLDCAPEYANEALYRRADVMQKGNSLSFSTDGSSYFEYLNGYVASVHDSRSDSSTLTPDQKSYIQARRTADDAYLVLIKSFQAKQSQDPSYQWQSHLETFGQDYRAACAIRDLAGTKLQATDLVKTMQGLDAAQARVDAHQGNNMRCSTAQFILGDASRKTVDAASLIYRPFYLLPDFSTQALKWRENFDAKIAAPVIIQLNLREALTTSWASLGFPEWDEETPAATVEDVDEFENIGNRIYLTFTNVVPFRVARGLWEIQDFRDVLKQLRPDASERYKRKTNKTISLLLGYGVQIRMKLSPEFMTAVKKDKPISSVLGGIPLVNFAPDEKRTTQPQNDAYPNLLAVLVQKC